ncbi:hypothetical protein [Mycolicibacterium neoaurum]|uniref:hypothetical protein n=1 Tax=Mycolicibacterium neoaurum TaxID=1795 RepID=UPI001F4CB26F|nr:hypothetical protein [Mycolicibacterium neoaurum]
MTDEDFNQALTMLTTDPYKTVMQTSFELIEQAKEIAYDDDVLFNMLFDMVLDYQKTSFERLSAAS